MTKEEFWNLKEEHPMIASISSDCSTMTFKLLGAENEYILVLDDASQRDEYFEMLFRGSKAEMKNYLQDAVIPEHSAESLAVVLEEN